MSVPVGASAARMVFARNLINKNVNKTKLYFMLNCSKCYKFCKNNTATITECSKIEEVYYFLLLETTKLCMYNLNFASHLFFTTKLLATIY